MDIGTLWNNFLKVSPIKGTTINFIDTPFIGRYTFVSVLYACFIVFCTFIFVIKAISHTRKGGIRDAFIIASFVVFLLFALRMDYNWLVVFKDNYKRLSRLKLPKRLLLLDPTGAYLITSQVKRVVKSNEKVELYLGDLSVFKRRYRYYLLPVKFTTKDGDYVLVVNDNIKYDPKRHELTKEGVVIKKNVTLILSNGINIFLYKINS